MQSKLNTHPLPICYIAGKITGDEENALHRFAKAKRMLGEKYEVVYNPFDLPKTAKIKRLEREIKLLLSKKLRKSLEEELWSEYMRVCIRYLMKCDVAYFLPDWKDSRGAKVEHQLCVDLGIEIKYL